MLPTICKIGPLTVYSYGLMLALAVIVCAFFLSREADSKGIKADLIFDLVFWIVVGGILGARIFFIALNFPYFLESPLEIVMIQNGGLAWQGGLIFGSLFGIGFTRKKNIPFLKILDLVAPYIALGQSIGRIGCFLNGCCYGKPSAWGIYFPVHDAVLHPTQLYLTAGLLTIFILLKRYQRSHHHAGQVFTRYLILASLLRFGIEFLRADHYVTFLGLSIYQFLCLGFITLALYANTRLKSQAGKLSSKV